MAAAEDESDQPGGAVRSTRSRRGGRGKGNKGRAAAAAAALKAAEAAGGGIGAPMTNPGSKENAPANNWQLDAARRTLQQQAHGLGGFHHHHSATTQMISSCA